MPTIPEFDCDVAPANDVAPGNDNEFLAIVCSEEQLLRAEFDAIIAEEWPSPR